jgi:hypothetical protein
MNSRYILLLVFCMLGTAGFTQHAKKQPVVKTVKGSTKKKVVTEAEAKKLHADQLAKEGKQNVRRAYKRTDFETASNTDALAIDGVGQTHEELTLSPKPKVVVMKTVPNTAKAAPTMPKFIETIVLERKEG